MTRQRLNLDPPSAATLEKAAGQRDRVLWQHRLSLADRVTVVALVDDLTLDGVVADASDRVLVVLDNDVVRVIPWDAIAVITKTPPHPADV